MKGSEAKAQTGDKIGDKIRAQQGRRHKHTVLPGVGVSEKARFAHKESDHIPPLNSVKFLLSCISPDIYMMFGCPAELQP